MTTLTDDQKKEMDKEIFAKTQSLWQADLTESHDAITIDDLDEILKKYGL